MPNPPQGNGDHQPRRCREEQCSAWRQGRESEPRYQAEGDKSATAEHCPSRIERRRFAPAATTADSRPLLLFGLVLLEQARARRKNRRKRQEQSANERSPMPRHESGSDRDSSAEDEAHEKLVPTCLLERTNVDRRNHARLHVRSTPAAPATSAQTVNAAMETQIAGLRPETRTR